MAIEAEVTRDGTAAPRPEMVGSVRIGSSCWLVILEIRVSQSSRNSFFLATFLFLPPKPTISLIFRNRGSRLRVQVTGQL